MEGKENIPETEKTTENVIKMERTGEGGAEVISIKIPKEGEELEEMAKNKKKKKNEKFPSKKFLIILGVCLFVFGSLSGVGLYFLLKDDSESNPISFVIDQKTEKTEAFSPLTGLPIADASLATAPTFCVQIPNGTDGARPQAGLNEAGVVFEAIAEAGITRFAAVFQDPTAGIIGPIRSLRMYYLNWDTPFDCTITHAGGADDALAAVRSGGYKDLTENYTYMWRGQTNTSVNRRWNNLFTSGSLLKQANSQQSNVKGFSRQTPEAAEEARISSLAGNVLDIDTATSESVKVLTPKVSKIYLDFASSNNFGVVYSYNPETNSYARAYASGVPHSVYNCSGDLNNATPELSCGDPVQLSPKVVVAMIVQEKRAADNYHEDIISIGSGKAFVFQNGEVVEGTWSKPDKATQISFKDTSGNEISLVPGQTWVSAVPAYGSVEFE